MNTFNGSVVLAAGTIKTLQELIVAAISNRNVNMYPNAAAKAAHIDRLKGNRSIRDGSIRTTGAIYSMDVTGGVLNGEVKTSDGVTLVAGHFTAVPGGGELWGAAQVKSLINGLDAGSRVFYNAGADVTIYLDLSF